MTKQLFNFYRTANDTTVQLADRQGASSALRAYCQNWAGQPGIWDDCFKYRGRYYYLNQSF